MASTENETRVKFCKLCIAPYPRRPPRERRKLLCPNCEDFPALNLDFDAEGRTQIGALYDRSTDPDASRKIGQFERVKDSAAAGVSDHGMFGGAKTIVIFQLVQLRDVFELAIAVRRILCKGPITAGL